MKWGQKKSVSMLQVQYRKYLTSWHFSSMDSPADAQTQTTPMEQVTVAAAAHCRTFSSTHGQLPMYLSLAYWARWRETVSFIYIHYVPPDPQS